MPENTPSPSPEYLIVGQGLAGSILALTLLEAGRRVGVVARPGGAGASLAALGVVNPVTGLRFTPSYRWAEARPVAGAFYQGWEGRWGERLFFPAPIYRHFTGPAELRRWAGRSEEIPAEIAQEIGVSPWTPHLLTTATAGGVWLQGGGWLDVPRFLELTRTELLGRGILVEADYLPEEQAAENTIFCDGYTGLCENPYLADLPRRSAQGEILLIRTDELPPAEALGIVQRGIFLVPMREPGLWRAGANYGWRDLHGQPTPEGRAYVERALRVNFHFSWQVVDHLAGVRPIVTDKLPVLGSLPGRAGLAVLNGLASKGALLGPWLARLLLMHLEGGAPIPPELDVRRNFPL